MGFGQFELKSSSYSNSSDSQHSKIIFYTKNSIPNMQIIFKNDQNNLNDDVK